ncbi:Peptidase_C39 like family protein [Sporobacter termitidis DSM 10068]|uniref:Peptidase_C39 like family protein n=1 Tax=Sporobacter termitidis DSM 10068 TaxID=1123282 RepID=A0A1M5TVP2_9FIRM|nr:peptidase C39 [Sporobacter termitidis]SHH54666.1 Peptidase_C39 like family protein [Sporobacter termitidis DSM 10068]
MKNPLNYQTTEFDCGPTTLMNAMSFLFRREDIPPDIMKHIMLYSLDAYNVKGEFGKNGTSQMAMMFLCNWLNQFAKVKKFPLHCEFLTGADVSVSQTSKIVACLQQGGAVVVRLRHVGWHYVLLTGADNENVFMFDPYYRKKPFNTNGVALITDEPFSKNRSVSYEILSGEGNSMYNLGPKDVREAIILFNLETQKTPARTIEYFI